MSDLSLPGAILAKWPVIFRSLKWANKPQGHLMLRLWADSFNQKNYVKKNVSAGTLVVHEISSYTINIADWNLGL
jgi:hypothetical protein